MTDSKKFDSKKVASLVRAAASEAAEKVILRLSEMADQEKTGLGELHALIGETRTVPVYKTETITETNEAGETVTREEDVETGETKEVVERFDLVKTILDAVREVSPSAFVIQEGRGRGAGVWKGSKPAPVIRPEMTPEEKKSAREANRAQKTAQSQADALQVALNLLKAQGVAVPDSMFTKK